MTQRALVTGATGLLGREVAKAFESAGWEVIGAGFIRASPPKIVKLDIEDEQAVTDTLDEIRPNVVIHCAANRSPDSCNSDPDGARRTNVTATANVAKATNSRKILLIYISTDYVFPGKPGDAPYGADATPAPTNIYGQTKLDGEKAVLAATKDGSSKLGVILRVPVLYGTVSPEGNNKESAVNVLMDVLWKSQAKLDALASQRIKMDDWAIRYPTNTADVARVCLDIARLWLGVFASENAFAKEQLPTVLQFSAEEKMTKYEICRVFGEIMGLSTDGLVADRSAAEETRRSGATQRPFDCHLDTGELRKVGIEVECVGFEDWWRRECRAFRH